MSGRQSSTQGYGNELERSNGGVNKSQVKVEGEESNPVRSSSRSIGRNECFKCGRAGHWARDCPKGSSAGEDLNNEEYIVYSYGGRKSPYWEDDCFKCGRSGHWQRECPGVGNEDAKDGKRREFEVCLGRWPF